MLSTLALFGHPFDCTHDHYWIEPSKSFKRDKTSKLTIDKTKVLSPDSLKRLFLLTLKTLHPAIKIFETELKQALSSRIFGSDDSEHEKEMLTKGDFKTIDRAFDIIEKAKNLFSR